MPSESRLPVILFVALHTLVLWSFAGGFGGQCIKEVRKEKSSGHQDGYLIRADMTMHVMKSAHAGGGG